VERVYGSRKTLSPRTRYNGVNIVSLWAAAETKGYDAPIWATYRQWAELSVQVRGGEKASLVVFYKEFTAEPHPEDAEDDGRRYSVAEIRSSLSAHLAERGSENRSS